MGLIDKGILGGFRNKTGTVVGAFWRGLDVIRSLPRKGGKAPTEKQLNQQAKFRLVTEFLSYISGLVDDGYKASAKVATPMNEAVADNLEFAITGIAPDFSIDYTKVVFSKGKIEISNKMVVGGIAGTGKVNFQWQYSGMEEKTISGSDTVNLLVYNPTQNRFVTMRSAAIRSDKSFDLQCPADFTGELMHCYMSFHSVRRKPMASKSAYVGQITVL